MAGERKIRGLTPNQMSFVDAYLIELDKPDRGTTAHAGYVAMIAAGYQGNELSLYSKASTLSRHPAIRAEIDRRQLAARRASGMDKVFLISAALELYQLAKDDQRWAASISALSWAARIGGFVVDKVESKNWNINGSVEDIVKGLSLEELQALAADRIQERLALKEGSQEK